MKAIELNGNHIGKTITMKKGADTITAVMRGVEHIAETLIDGRLYDAVPDVVTGRRETTITFLNFGVVQVDPDTEVVVN